MNWYGQLKVYLALTAVLIALLGACGLFVVLLGLPLYLLVPLGSGVALVLWLWYIIYRDLNTIGKE